MKRKKTSANKKLRMVLTRFGEVPARDPEAEAAGRRNFLRQAAGLRASASRRPQPSTSVGPDWLPSLFHGKSSLLIPAGLVSAFLALVLFFSGSAVTVYAAQNSLPDEALYGIKTLSEDAVYLLPVSTQTKVDLTLRFTDRRIDEIVRLHTGGRSIPANVLERYPNELDLVLELAAGMDDTGLAKSLEQASDHADMQLKQITMLLGADPDASNLFPLESRLEEQIQKIELGKAAPQEFRSTIQEEPREKTRTAAAVQDSDSGPNRPQTTPDAGKNDGDGGKPTKDKEKQASYTGTIAAVDPGSLTLTLKDGSSRTFILTADTKINISGRSRGATVADLKVGDEATVQATKDESGALTATKIDVKSAKPVLNHYTGTVTDYQAGVRITIREKGGASRTFLITSETKIQFDSKDASQILEIGSEVTIAAEQDVSGGTPTAKEIIVKNKKQKAEKPASYTGTIAAVDSGSLTLTLKDGSSRAFILTADTKINISGRSRGATAADLKVGDEATVQATKDESGAWTAIKIDVKSAKPVLEQYTGTVTDYQAGVRITIQEKNGMSRTFLITSGTKITFDRKDETKTLEIGSEVTIVAERDTSGGTPIAMRSL